MNQIQGNLPATKVGRTEPTLNQSSAGSSMAGAAKRIALGAGAVVGYSFATAVTGSEVEADHITSLAAMVLTGGAMAAGGYQLGRHFDLNSASILSCLRLGLSAGTAAKIVEFITDHPQDEISKSDILSLAGLTVLSGYSLGRELR